jgi:hypothetical protein
VRVAASDEPSHAAERARTASLESKPFLVDLTPPRVEPLDQSVRSERALFRFRLHDAASPITEAEYSLDGGPWQLVLPDDLVYDETAEELTIELVEPASGEHSLVVRAMDEARNVGSGKAVFTAGR